MLDFANGIEDNDFIDLAKLAFSANLLPVSNLKFSGPKIAYRRSGKNRIICENAPVFKLFIQKLDRIVKDLKYFEGLSKEVKPELHFGDSRCVSKYVKETVDLVLTSPPYLKPFDKGE